MYNHYPGIHDDTCVTPGTPVSSTFKLIFSPFNKSGFCDTAQVGGYINTGIFNSQIDTTVPFFLTVRRDKMLENYNVQLFAYEL